MARIRSIKPDFWKSEKVAAMTGAEGRQARLLFIGLWNFAEDHGVIGGNPVYLRSEVFGYDEDVATTDIDRWLAMLEAHGFIVRYQRDGRRYVWICGWDHQKIDKPGKTTLPLPREAEKNAPRILAEDSPNARRTFAVGYGVEGSGYGVETEEKGGDQVPAAPEQLALHPPVPSGPTPEDLQGLWNSHATLKRWRDLTDARKTHARTRLKERPWSEWVDIVARIARTPFCLGENDRQWAASPDWFLKPGTATAVLEGKYDRHGSGRGKRADITEADYSSEAI